MNMKKVLALLLSGTMLFSVSACGSANDEAKGQKKEETKKVSAEAEEEGEIDYYGFAEETPIKVGFAWGKILSLPEVIPQRIIRGWICIGNIISNRRFYMRWTVLRQKRNYPQRLCLVIILIFFRFRGTNMRNILILA